MGDRHGKEKGMVWAREGRIAFVLIDCWEA